MNPADEPVVDDHARRLDRDAVGLGVVPRDARAQRRDAERLGVAEPAGRSAARAAASAVAGAGAAGWPTSMWMTRPPAASMRAAAAITSITMNGGTSLRAEGAISRFAASSIDSTVCYRARQPPRCCRIRRLRSALPRGATARYQLAGPA